MAAKDFLKLVKQLREQTGAGIMDCRQALEEAEGDLTAAKEILAEKRESIADKKAERETSEGGVFSYIHANNKIGAIVALECETDFVARTEDFQKLGRELAMQTAAMNPTDEKELLQQDYIRNPQQKVGDLIKQVIGKTGENIQVKRITRLSIDGD